MHSNKALTSMLFQYVKMTRSIMCGMKKPDDQSEWRNIFQLMFHLRQALACSKCGNLVSDPHTPIREPCHCVCGNCRTSSIQLRFNCITCRHAFQVGEEGFEHNINLNYTVVGFIGLCKVIVTSGMAHKWSNLQISTQNGPITFDQLIQEGYSPDGIMNGQNLGSMFRRKVKEKEHHCRCGSGAKKGDGRGSGNLTCLGQRCACYKERKACVNCKCIGCKNPNGSSSNDA